MPQPISAILRRLSSLEANGQRPEQTLREIRDIPKPEHEREYVGTVGEARKLVEWLIRAVTAENKPGQRMGQRVQALRNIELELGTIEERGSFDTAFPQIDPARFYLQVAYRVLEPKWIDQADLSMCDIVALVTQMATLGQVTVKPHPVLLRARSVRGLAECDYVTLTSIRNSAAIIDSGTLNLEGMGQADRCNWLRCAGYFPVENHTMESTSVNREIEWYYPEGVTPEKVLRKMDKRSKEGFNILMCEDAAISVSARRNATMSSNLESDRHLVYVNSLTVDNDYVYLNLHSWREAQRTRIKKSDFLVHFLGFIAYKDR